MAVDGMLDFNCTEIEIHVNCDTVYSLEGT